MADVASRPANRVQLSTDAFRAYPGAVERAFGWIGVDFATIAKQCATEGAGLHRGTV